jgi:hypothetical protein
MKTPSGMKAKLERDERFLRKIAAAREDIRRGRFITLEELKRKERLKKAPRNPGRRR